MLESRGDAFVTRPASIVGQQISVRAAQAVWDRCEPRCRASRKHILAVAGATLREAGLSLRKVEYIQDLAQHLKTTGCAPDSGSAWTTKRSFANSPPYVA